jgi:hypothetical protein
MERSATWQAHGVIPGIENDKFIGWFDKTHVEVKWFMSKHLPQPHRGDWTEPSKFDQLRIKTDMQLVQVINTELGLGISYAHQALKSADTWAVAEECNHRAKRAYTKLSRLVPVCL